MSKNDKIYEVIKQKIIARLEEAIETKTSFHWCKNWAGIPTGNAIMWNEDRKNYSGYRGVNALLLEGLYITYTQLQAFQIKHPEINFKIRKGCHKETVYFYKLSNFLKETTNKKTGETEMSSKSIPFLKFYSVFSINDIENLHDFFKLEENKHEYSELMKNADEVIADYCKRDGLEFIEKENSDKCFYSPSEHKVVVPPKSAFKSLNGENGAYSAYSAYFHELVHSSMKTLKREHGTTFGSELYCQEELVAEIGSEMLMNMLGLQEENCSNNSLAYIQGWLSKIENGDVGLLVKSANAAQQAVDLILNIKKESEKAA